MNPKIKTALFAMPPTAPELWVTKLKIKSRRFGLATRKPRGGMLGLAWLIFGLLVVGICIGLSFGSMFFFQSQMQKFADDLALTGACQLNDGNRIGQMNDLTARCRQL